MANLTSVDARTIQRDLEKLVQDERISWDKEVKGWTSGEKRIEEELDRVLSLTALRIFNQLFDNLFMPGSLQARSSASWATTRNNCNVGSIAGYLKCVGSMHWRWERTAFLSIILAFMNILPIPALDGGHVMFLIYEVVARRKPSDKFLEYAQMAGVYPVRFIDLCEWK